MADHDHDPALVEKAAKVIWDRRQGCHSYEIARAVLDAVAADITRQAVEQALKPIEAPDVQIRAAAEDRWEAHQKASDMGDLDAANVHGDVAEALDEVRTDLRAAVEQARGGATT